LRASSPAEILRIETAEFARAAHQSGDFPRDGRPEIAFVGRSNVGKSSLMNRLLGRKGLARTSSTPGRTQAVHYYEVNRRFYFVDLPGYGYAKAGKEDRRRWGALVDGYLQHALPRAQVILLVDGKVGATPLDEQALHYLVGLGARPIVAVTKIDRITRSRRGAALRDVRAALALDEAADVIAVSAVSGEGTQELWGAMTRHLEGHD
jgi:GTP-binding protein